MSIDPIKPYLPIIGLMLMLVFLFGGCSWGKSIQKAKNADIIAKKDVALQNAATALMASKAAIEEINAEAALRIKAAQDQATAAGNAATVLEARKKEAERERDAFERQLAKARRKPDCAALFDADIAKTCGVTIR